jgi:hypothetical protein
VLLEERIGKVAGTSQAARGGFVTHWAVLQSNQQRLSFLVQAVPAGKGQALALAF